jgi:CheY-like chemotaxis protein
MVTRHTLAESTSDGQGNSTCRDTGHVAHVLVADDNIVNQKAASRNLEKLGCKVELVDNGQEALDAVMKNSYDLVFMDCQMPVLDGLDATRAIRSQVPGGDKLRIVAMTANALQGDRGKCLDAGADDFITKPDR